MFNEKALHIDPTIGNVGDEQTVSMHGGGKTHPGACYPGGMVQLCADTITGGDNGTGYNYCNNTIEGFSFNHLSGIGWYGDLGNLQVMPVTGETALRSGTNEFAPLRNGGEGWRSVFSHANECAKAGYYSVWLERYNIQAQATVTQHTGFLRFTYPECADSRLIFNLSRRIGGRADWQQLRIIDNRHFEGYIKCSPAGGGFGHGDGGIFYTLYFYCELSKPISSHFFFSNEVKLNSFTEYEGEDVGLCVSFSTQANEEITLKTGLSYVDLEGARANFRKEAANENFDSVKQNAFTEWEAAISVIEIETDNETDKALFYTCLYHALLDPRTAVDVDGRYRGADGNIHFAEKYTYRTVFSGWDVYRSEFPLLTLIAPNVVNDEVNTLISIAKAKKSAYPRWELMGVDSGCMVGDPGVMVVADAFVKGIRNYDVDDAYKIARSSCIGGEYTPIRSELEFFNKHGFNPGKLSSTLEELLADYTASRFAAEYGRAEDAKLFYESSMRFAENYNPDTGFMGPRDKSGSFLPVDDEYDTEGCVESNIYQQSWFMPQDVAGLIGLFGRERFIELLERFFERADFSALWNEDYNHSNEPCHNVTHWFNYAGLAHRTQYWVRQVQKQAYRKGAYGFCGNEDVGQLSAWYVLSAIGFAQTCPAVEVFNLNSPLFRKASVKLNKQYHSCTVADTFTVVCDCDPLHFPYIKAAYLNGQQIERAYLLYSEITAGGELRLEMSDLPCESFGCKQLPPSAV